MARQLPDVPDLDLRKKSRNEVNQIAEIHETKIGDNKSFFDLTDRFSNTSKNFMLGTCCGWIAGVLTIRVGRIAAVGLGGSVILLHFASEFGYINVNWDRVKESARQGQKWLDGLLKFVRYNGCYAVGFTGGFFFGIAST